jgi:2-polyprenyl-6-methoxyphenol hydroxylase-like FAD-dependent oxidoreductase
MLAMAVEPTSTPANIREVHQADCCIVGAGPAGAVLALLLARRGISVLLLEAHGDFEREFRGDTIHPSVMEIMEELDLAERLLEIRHTKIHSLTIQTDEGPVTIADFGRLKTPYPFITLLPQSRFLEFVTGEASRFPHFRLEMGARVRELIDEDGAVRGVRYLGRDGWHEARALLTVGADGRFSRIRQAAGLESIATSAPMDVMWFHLPRRPDDPEGIIGVFRPGRILVLLDRSDYWQVGYVFPKGGYQKLRAGGVEALRRSVAELAPQFADRVEVLKEWTQVSLLSVESNRLRRWYRPGLLLIGDAAHVMSPVGGVGINYAIQDAVVAVNVLGGPLKAGRVSLEDLDTVQRRREWPTRIIQAFQSLIQRWLVSGALGATQPFRLPIMFRLVLSLPILRNLPGRLIGIGVWRVHVES